MKPTFALAMLAFAATAAAAAPYAREVDVAQPGWVRVALDGPAVAASDRWQVVGPGGTQLSNALVAEVTGEKQLRVVSVDESADGWRFTFDAGVAPMVHDVFTLVLQAEVVAPRCRLEGSDDLERWTSLAEFAVFRIGYSEQLQGRRASYPAASWRFLRLSWPRSAGQPRLERATVTAPPSSRVVTAPATVFRATPRDGQVVLEIELPSRAVDLHRLVLDAPGAAPAPAALYAEDHGRWRALARRAPQSTPESQTETLEFVVDKTIPGRILRVDIDGPAAPQYQARVEMPQRWLVFQAREAGRHVIVAGRAPAAEGALGELDIDKVTAPATEASIGTETAAPPAALSAASTTALKPGRLPRHWKAFPVLAPGVAAGEVVAIDLPPELLGLPGVRVDRLRPMAGGQTLPFALDRGAVLERVGPVSPAVPLGPADLVKSGAGQTFSLRLPADAEQVTQVELLAPAFAAFRAVVAATAVASSRPGVEQRTPVNAGGWDCPGGAAGRCALFLDLNVVAPASALELTLTAESGDVEVEAAELWRVRDRLIFAWPASTDVRLLAGLDPFESWPAISEAVAAELLAAPVRPASIDLRAQAAEAAALGRRGRLAVLLAVGLAAIALLVVLARSLTRRPPAPGPSP